MKYLLIVVALNMLFFSAANSQNKKSQTKSVVSDANTPLHLMQPDYVIPYGAPACADIKATMDVVLRYLESSTPARVVDGGGKAVSLENIDKNSRVEQGQFRLTSYEWGVTYSAMLAAAEATGDDAYKQYAIERMSFLADACAAFSRLADSTGFFEPVLRSSIVPHALDDCGAICAAMMKAQSADAKLDLRKQIDVYFNRVMYDEYRLTDGTLARCRPHYNTLWLDDMFMGIPSIALKGRMEREGRFYAEAAKQVKQFSERMFVAETGLFRHGWVEAMQPHPAFYWARANGWAMLTLCEVLDALPTNHNAYNDILALLQKHIAAVAALQSHMGFWHQLLDRNDTYHETSATAIFTYCIAHAINKGWIDAKAYGAVAVLGWNAVATKVTSQGRVEGTCVGTGMGFDAAFYAYRPVSAAAAHGYGPVIWAGAEMFRLMMQQYPQNNDAAVQFYNKQQQTKAPIFGVADPSRPAEMAAGHSRKGNRPVVFVIGDSTVKNGRGLGDGEMWGWASFFDLFVDSTRASVENHALGGRSSRTFITEGLWHKVLGGIRPGDYLVVQFGHNDGGALGTGRARASLNGTGYETETTTLERNGRQEVVGTYGHYMRQYIRQAKAKGATVVVLSHTPRNGWTNGKIRRCTDSYAKWSAEVAQAEGATFVDLNAMAADRFDDMGEAKGKTHFKDNVHTSFDGAILHAKCVAEAFMQLSDSALAQMIKRDAIDRDYSNETLK